jgi:hypothetical protein
MGSDLNVSDTFIDLQLRGRGKKKRQIYRERVQKKVETSD